MNMMTAQFFMVVSRQHPISNTENVTMDDCIHILKRTSARQPMNVQENALFLVNTYVIKISERAVDGNCSYRNNRSKVWSFEVSRSFSKSKEEANQEAKIAVFRKKTRGKLLIDQITYRKNTGFLWLRSQQI